MINKLRFVSLPSIAPDQNYISEYLAAYKCWSQVWQATYTADLKIQKSVYSDEFTRQMEVDAIFFEQTCIATLFLRRVDLSLPTTQNDSYFRVWSPADFKKLGSAGCDALILSGLSVHPEWRGDSLQVKIKDLLLYFVTRTFIESQASSMAGTTRKAKNVHDLCYRFGAKKVNADVDHFNSDDKVDLVAWFQDSVTSGDDPKIKEIGEPLWQNRLAVFCVSNHLLIKSVLPLNKSLRTVA